MGRHLLRTGDLVKPGFYTRLESLVDGDGIYVTDSLKEVVCLVIGLGEAIWNTKKQSKRTKRVCLFDPVSCKMGWCDVRWVQKVK